MKAFRRNSYSCAYHKAMELRTGWGSPGAISVFFATAAALLIMWQMLFPGYVLTMDLVFTPTMHITTSSDNFINLLPVQYLVSFLAYLMPAWIVEKMLLFGLFFSLLYAPMRYLPFVSEHSGIRLVASLVYGLNPFVYERFLAGQWALLAGYAVLPFFLHALFALTQRPSSRASVKLAMALCMIGVFSVHLLLMTTLVVLGWIVVESVRATVSNDDNRIKKVLRWLGTSALLSALFSSYWIIAASVRTHPLEAAFDTTHFEAFAASAHGSISVIPNLLTLNGFWGERALWAYYFASSQSYSVFWVGFFSIVALVVIGFFALFRSNRAYSIYLLFIFLGALVFATGASDTPFKSFNLFLYQHVPLWAGLRDSHKWVALIALVYAICVGSSLAWIRAHVGERLFSFAVLPTAIIVAILFGALQLFGFRGQLQPTWYPQSWEVAAEIVAHIRAKDPIAKILVLPWHGYMSLAFSNDHIVANPAHAYFGDSIVQSQSIELAGVYDQSVDVNYRNLDLAIRNTASSSNDRIIEAFRFMNIRAVVYLQDIREVDELSYDFLDDTRFKKLLDATEIQVYEL